MLAPVNAIRKIRREILRLTQEELAAVCGVTQSTIVRWEAGESQPLIGHAVAMARFARSRRRRLRFDDFAEGMRS